MKHETPIDLWLYEKEAFADGFQLVCGVDEAGRGPLAGPVCAAAVILPPELVIPGLNDSKKLTDKKRQLRHRVCERAGDRRDQHPAGDLPRHGAGDGAAGPATGAGAHRW